MTSPPKRKSASKSPPILPAEFLTPGPSGMPAPPVPSPHPGTTRKASSNSDIGILKPSGQVSQNDDRLSHLPTLQHGQNSGSESSGSAQQSHSITETPYLDDSPVEYTAGHQLSQKSSTSGSVRGETRPARYTQYHHEAESQSMDLLSVQEGSASGHDNTQEMSFVHSEVSHIFNASDESGSSKANNSFGTNTSGSSNSRTSDSQASDISFTNAETSTPRRTPIPAVPSQKSTVSDSDQNPSSSSSQLSPTRIISASVQHRHRQVSVALIETQSQDQGPSSVRPISTIPEDDVLKISDDNTQQGLGDDALKIPDDSTQLGFGDDISSEEVEAAFVEVQGDTNATQDFCNPESVSVKLEGDTQDLASQDILSAKEPPPPPAKHKKRGDRRTKGSHVNTSLDSTEQNYEFLSSDDDEASRSTLDNRLDLNMSQSIAQSDHSVQSRSLSSRSQRVSVTTTSTTVSVSSTTNQKEKSADVNTNITPQNNSAEHSVESVLETQEIPESASQQVQRSFNVRPSKSPRSRPTTKLPSPRRSRSDRSTPSETTDAQALPSSQSSDTSQSSQDPILSRLRSAASQETGVEPVFSAVPKRRRIRSVEANAVQVTTSVGDEEFWSSDPYDSSSKDRNQRSRSPSQEIFSLPHGEEEEKGQEEEEDLFPLGSRHGHSSQSEDEGPSSPGKKGSPRGSRSSRKLPTTRTIQTRDLRRRSASQASGSTTTPTMRRLRSSATEVLRAYKANAAVWALWQKSRSKSYYAGRVIQKKSENKHIVRFIDNYEQECKSSDMRPLMLKLGVNVTVNIKESKEYPATVEGFQINPEEIEEARVDVRYGDDLEATVRLHQISMTQSQLEDADNMIEWDEESVGLSSETEPSTSSSTPPGTPRKGKSIAQLGRDDAGPSTPSRRGKKATPQAGPQTPSRRTQDLFKGFYFVLSVSFGQKRAAG
ncbi:hypothetical protein BCR41DRAFT_51927 [Lobosporangium transversale]|uniref:Tudor domain-containing protein n=1 Tax=Lobosporangium transversale TaxID=64571 RepID=A0A1Y2GSJ0_9FUNG|nr:hypothetical protein BCR41DRAFT_51927 [Lobosporangium transversale]ORZ16625.1 hypothetical protein BCR41DRAFT_51927 [Lobosporangium transversale]|eukprot:XP_021881560.1 hypothetical protein BCR41DRAFT_51927 [Lobosporangium transversale]